MLDRELAKRWAAEPGFAESVRHWAWCRDALPLLLKQLATPAGATSAAPLVDTAVLAEAFWAWARRLDNEARFESLDPVDFAHYACGMLLVNLLTRRPLLRRGDDSDQEQRVLTGAALTVLAAWRAALGAPPLPDDLPLRVATHWNNYLKTIAFQAESAIPFLDVFTGCEPEWQDPLMLLERPAFKRALLARRRAETP